MTTVSVSPGWAIYLRVSNEDKQTPERSFAMQRRAIETQLLAQSDSPLTHEYKDILTGTSPKREDYQKMLRDAEYGRFSHLGLYRADRFGRDAIEGLKAAQLLMTLGIKIRVAHMPSLCPETPDGFFMFMLQMGLAQREVEVMKTRIADGMEAKYRGGGWPGYAPFGYVNKERLISSNKYHRWVEIDPEISKVVREAWDLLLVERYSLREICEELHRRGYVRGRGHPWVWQDKNTGRQQDARATLHKVLTNPFYAGWVVSKRFNIKMGEVRGRWQPIVSDQEFRRGIKILERSSKLRSRPKKKFYLLQDIAVLRYNKRQYKLYVTTSKGHSAWYKYYYTQARPRGGKQIHIACETVDVQIPSLLEGLTVDSSLLPKIRRYYEQQINSSAHASRKDQLEDVRNRLNTLRSQELQLGRMVLTGQISEEAYKQLRLEWEDKVRVTEIDLHELEQDVAKHVDDLELALLLLSSLDVLYAKLKQKEQKALLQIIFKRIIVEEEGEIIDHELHSPFAYLVSLKTSIDKNLGSSKVVSPGPFRIDPANHLRKMRCFLYTGMATLKLHHVKV